MRMVGVGWGRMVYYYHIYIISGWNDILFPAALNLESGQIFVNRICELKDIVSRNQLFQDVG